MSNHKTPEEKRKWDGVFPHCDGRVVHKPGECAVCDEHAGGLQYLRQMWGINYTGHHKTVDSNGIVMLPCPAEIARPLVIINKWAGNMAKPADWLEKLDIEMKAMAVKFDKEMAADGEGTKGVQS